MVLKSLISGFLCICLFALCSCGSYHAVNKNVSDNYYFNFFKTNVHYIPMGNWFELGNDIIDSVDVKTVEILGQNYMKDNTHVYFKSTRIKNVDIASFKVLCSDNGSFARDKNRIYYESNSFQDINVDSFSFLGGPCEPILKDNKYVYSIYTVPDTARGNGLIFPIPGLDAKKYQYLNALYGKDETQVYYKGVRIVEAESNTFILLEDYYAKDAHAIYFDGLKIQGLDAATFSFIAGGGYSKDQHGVYYGLDAAYNDQGEVTGYAVKQVTGADPESFVMVQSDKIDYAKDRNNYYWAGQVQ